MFCGTNPKEHSLTFDTGLDSIRCPECGLVQFRTLSTVCKRCRRSLGIRYTTLTLSRRNLQKENSSEGFIRAFGHMMLAMRLDHRWTQAECAIRLNTSRSHLSRLESGRLSPSFSMLFRAARVFSVDRVIFLIRTPSASGSKS